MGFLGFQKEALHSRGSGCIEREKQHWQMSLEKREFTLE